MTMSKPVPCADCMSRRHFLATSSLSAATLAVAGCGDGFISGVPPKIVALPTGPVTLKVGDVPELATNGVIARVFSSIGVKRTGATTFVAMQLVCTHQGCGVTISTNTQLDCPCHLSQFDGDGNVTRGPADRALPRYTTSYDTATDILTIS
jgi:Rieske Fe-S protein